MKVLNLQCSFGHAFEGWFGSEEGYRSQLERGLLVCPQCGATQIQRLPSAPRLNLSGAKAPDSGGTVVSPGTSVGGASTPVIPEVSTLGALHSAWLKAAELILAQTEDVGEQFCDEARRIHYGEAQERAIRGQASAEERAELADEGIEVFALPLPVGVSGPKH
jgi:hypothetical protein